MQIIDGKVYAEKADRNHLKTTPIFALRGTISDRMEKFSLGILSLVRPQFFK